MGEVVSPRDVTYSGTCHQWLRYGASFSLIFPTICVHMCRVSRVSFQASSGSAGQASASTFMSDLHRVLCRDRAPEGGSALLHREVPTPRDRACSACAGPAAI